MSNNELHEEKPVVTEEYLLSHGFERYSEGDEGPYQIPFFNEDDFHFREKKFDRQMFVVIFSPYNGNPGEGYSKSVYVQHDAGCGFIEIPFPWWDLPIEYFESVYYGIRGHYPNPLGNS
jgi:hypothetical protein